MRRIALGFDLGLNTGWAIVAAGGDQAPEILAAGNIDVRSETDLSARLTSWASQVGAVAGQAVERGAWAATYEVVRFMRGAGARYILMQEGIANILVPEAGLSILGVEQATLRAHAGVKNKSKHNPNPASFAAMAAPHFLSSPLLRSQDQAVAAFAAEWLVLNAVDVHAVTSHQPGEDV